MSKTHNKNTIATDPEGFIKDLDQWSEDVATILAQKENIELSTAHWEILFLVRDFYKDFDLSPAMRPLIKYIGQKTDKEKANSIYLTRLFESSKQESPAKVIARLAGLPKPKNCL